ncbi:helix-turn-helix domain-containing protein [Streptomyces malaysiensis]
MNWTPDGWARLAVLIRSERERRDLTRQQFADLAGVSIGSIRTAESGTAPKGRWPTTFSKVEQTLGWAPGNMRAILDGGEPVAAKGEQEDPPAEADSLPRRMADNQIRMAAADLARDAARFASAVQQYADGVESGRAASGEAHRLSIELADLLRQAARLDGMRDLAGLVE